MLNNKSKIRNRSPPNEGINLEGILSQKISLNTDIMDFFLIAGWDGYCFSSPIYKKAGKNLKNEIHGYAKKREMQIPISKIRLERRFYNCMIQTYTRGCIKTLGELKNIIETKGLVFPNIGYKSFKHFNEALEDYGIKPFKVGGKYIAGKTLKRHGLESIKKEY